MSKAVFVTGTSNGLGKALFELLAAENHSLFCIARRFLPEQIELASQSNHDIRLFQADLRDSAQLPTASDMNAFLQDKEISEVVLIHNAAVIEPIGAVGTLDPQQITEAIQVNLTAPILLSNTLFSLQAAETLPVKVLFISSGAAKNLKDGWALYCSTKAGGEMFFNVLAEQVKDQKRISVHNVNPGVMDTEMQKTIRSATDVHFPTLERFVRLKEEGQLAQPHDVARSIIRDYLPA
ncbi:SDR family NAD(P)-dependent oxidoreductase [Brevibacillus migulae]|uniref:SDR family NAD(P)-dependent oxidoreductase n=1 Tax=Brevibacillus migulae TaxID=1644114 RepID=UPI00106E0FE3|nr:SDR family NAD(P)-dependent oxidoreductase [Brevibacillus migulae]